MSSFNSEEEESPKIKEELAFEIKKTKKLEAQLKEAKEEIKELKMRLGILSGNLLLLISSAKRQRIAENETQKLEKEVRSLKKTIKRQKGEIEDSKEVISQQQETINELETLNKGGEEGDSKDKEDIVSLSKRLEEFSKENTLLKRQLGETKKELNEREIECKVMTDLVKSSKSMLRAKETDIQKLKIRIGKLEATINQGIVQVENTKKPSEERVPNKKKEMSNAKSALYLHGSSQNGFSGAGGDPYTMGVGSNDNERLSLTREKSNKSRHSTQRSTLGSKISSKIILPKLEGKNSQVSDLKSSSSQVLSQSSVKLIQKMSSGSLESRNKLQSSESSIRTHKFRNVKMERDSPDHLKSSSFFTFDQLSKTLTSIAWATSNFDRVKANTSWSFRPKRSRPALANQTMATADQDNFFYNYPLKSVELDEQVLKKEKEEMTKIESTRQKNQKRINELFDNSQKTETAPRSKSKKPKS